MENKKFKYMIEGSPIDFFYGTFSKEELIRSYEAEMLSIYQSNGSNDFKSNLNSKHEFIKTIVEKSSRELPHTIKYFLIPRYSWADMEICALAKISNNGTTFLFTDNEEFANCISHSSGYDFNIIKIM